MKRDEPDPSGQPESLRCMEGEVRVKDDSLSSKERHEKISLRKKERDHASTELTRGTI